MKKIARIISLLTITLFAIPSTLGIPITSDVTIAGAILIDTNAATGSLPTEVNATQKATMESSIGGILSTSTVDNTTVMGSKPQGGTLTDIGDGI